MEARTQPAPSEIFRTFFLLSSFPPPAAFHNGLRKVKQCNRTTTTRNIKHKT